MFRLLKVIKPVALGRWKTDKPLDATLRLIDLANCDSCGTCTIPEQTPEEPTYLLVEDSVVNNSYIPLPGSFDLYYKN